MSDIYLRLARHLDDLPGGFPATEDGIELKILRRLFTEEEAAIALRLTMKPGTVEAIAEQSDLQDAELGEQLEAMAKKGLIFRTYKDGTVMYSAAQFVIGIWEYHLNDLDPEFVKDVNDYLPHLMNEVWTKTDTKQLRVVPVSTAVTQDVEIASYEDAEELIRAQSKITVQPCICRKEHEVLGEPCDFPMAVCMSFGAAAYYYEENKLGRAVEIEEALRILEKGREAGLVIQPGNAQKSANICMCCGCCCQILKNLKKLAKPAEEVHSNYFAVVDEAECIACGLCADRCHMDAIDIEEAAVIDRDRCIGCGVCIPVCEVDAIQLAAKESSSLYVPPKLTYQTYLRMAKERGKLSR